MRSTARVPHVSGDPRQGVKNHPERSRRQTIAGTRARFAFLLRNYDFADSIRVPGPPLEGKVKRTRGDTRLARLPAVGIGTAPAAVLPLPRLADWRNWQTRQTQNLLSVRTSRFDPGIGYQASKVWAISGIRRLLHAGPHAPEHIAVRRARRWTTARHADEQVPFSRVIMR